MKKVTNITKSFLFVLCLLLSMSVVSFAATYHTTGMKDGVYTQSSAVDKNQCNYKMNAVIDGGKLTSFELGYYTGNGATKFSSGFLAAVTDPALKAQIQNILDETAYYTSQTSSTGDAMKVSRYSKSTDDGSIYSNFQSMWKQIVAQAGGSVVADAVATTQSTTTTTQAATTTSTTTAATTSTSNPKTGDNGIMIYVIAAGIALSGIIILGKKKLTA